MNIKLLDVKKLETEITKELNKQGHAGKYHLRSSKYGVVETSDRIAVVDKELVGSAFVKTDKEARISLDLFKDAGKNHIAIFPSFTVRYEATDIKEYETEKQETTDKFMGDRYRYNSRLESNEYSLVAFFEGRKK